MSEHPSTSATTTSSSLSSPLANPSDASQASEPQEPPDPFAYAEDSDWDQLPSTPSNEGAGPLPPSWPMTEPAPSQAPMSRRPAPMPAPPSMPMPVSSIQPLDMRGARPTRAGDSATFARLLREGAIEDSANDEEYRGEYDTAVVPSHWISEEERWNTATFLALTGHHATPRINRPPTRPLPRPKRFKRPTPVRSGALFIILLLLLVGLVIGAGLAYRTTITAVNHYFPSTTQPTATPPIVTPTRVPTSAK